MLPLGLFRSSSFAAATTLGLLVNVAFYGMIFVVGLCVQQGQWLSALHTGLAFGPKRRPDPRGPTCSPAASPPATARRRMIAAGLRGAGHCSPYERSWSSSSWPASFSGWSCGR